MAEEFLRFRVETWAEMLADAGAAAPGEYVVQIDAHQRKTHLVRSTTVVISADI